MASSWSRTPFQWLRRTSASSSGLLAPLLVPHICSFMPFASNVSLQARSCFALAARVYLLRTTGMLVGFTFPAFIYMKLGASGHAPGRSSDSSRSLQLRQSSGSLNESVSTGSTPLLPTGTGERRDAMWMLSAILVCLTGPAARFTFPVAGSSNSSNSCCVLLRDLSWPGGSQCCLDTCARWRSSMVDSLTFPP